MMGATMRNEMPFEAVWDVEDDGSPVIRLIASLLRAASGSEIRPIVIPVIDDNDLEAVCGLAVVWASANGDYELSDVEFQEPEAN
jgi:hypothetical protein